MGIRNGKMMIWKNKVKFAEYMMEGNNVVEAPQRMMVGDEQETK